MIDDASYRELIRTRAREPSRIAEAAAARRGRALPELEDGVLVVAADHPARGALAVGSDRLAMADRRELLGRVLTALSHPAVDGVLAAPDLMEELLLLGALEDRVALGSMNRGGVAGSVWELDDRFTAYDAASLRAHGLDGGKMLVRLVLDDRDTADTLEACGRAVSALAAEGLTAVVEPLPARRDGEGGLRVSDDPAELIRAVSVAAALGSTSAHTWLKLPVVDGMEGVAAATTLPVLLLGGDPAGRAEEVFEGWRRALALPQVRGLVAGRSLLYPPDGDVEGAVSRAAELMGRDG